jgi:hypothetical protein
MVPSVTTALPFATQPGDSSQLHRFSSRNFERMCRDLLREEKGIATSTLWGVEGQAQQGIDIQADADDGIHLELGQCKCYKAFGPKEIRKACSDFVRHWEYWKSKKVRRFILFVACEVENTQSRKAILEQKDWFFARGIRFEVWDEPQIIAKLNPHPGIVRQYFANPDHWVPVICGIPGGDGPWAVPQPQHDYASQLLGEQVNELAEALSSTAAQQVEAAREAWREGRRADAVRQVQEIRQDTTRWKAISPAVKAKVLRLEANLELVTTGDTAVVTPLADEADTLDPSGGGRLRMLLAYADGGPAAGLRSLDSQGIEDPEFRAGFLLEDGQVEACLARIEEVERKTPLTVELHRLRVLALLASGDVVGARKAAALMLEKQPRWEAVRRAAATVDYFSALSPAALPGHVPAWPSPVDWTRLKRDDEAVERLRASESVFREVAEQPGHPPEELMNVQGWRIACLASDPERQDEAAELCRSLLAGNPAHTPALVWTIARRFEIPTEPSLAALSEQLDDPDFGFPEIMALVNGALYLGQPERAAEVLDRTRARFVEEGEEVAWTAWRLRSALEADDSNLADTILDRIVQEPALAALSSLRARVEAERTGNPAALLGPLAAEYAANGSPSVLLESCVTAAHLEQWSYVSERSDDLVKRVGTAEAVRLAVLGHFNTGTYDRALALLDGHLDLFRQRRLPPDLRRVRVRAQEALGVLPAAVMEAEELVRDDPTTANLLELARVYASKGDLRSVVWVAQRLRDRSDLSPANALRLASALQLESLPLARELWRMAVKSKLSPAMVEHAVWLGYRLGVEPEMGALMRRFYTIAEKGGRFRVLKSVDEALALHREASESAARRDEFYRSGEFPTHVLVAAGKISLVDPYHAVLDENEQAPAPVRQKPLWTRHGGRPAPVLSDETVQWRLHADVTAILLGHHLGVLSAVERAFAPIRIAPELIQSLLEMRTRLVHPQISQVETARAVNQVARRGLFSPDPEDGIPAFPEELWQEEAGADWAGLWYRASAADALVCDDLPLYHGGDLSRPVELPEAVRARVAEPIAIADALLEVGAITKAAYEAAIARLPQPHPMQGTARPITGQRVYCARMATGTLAQMGLLEAACGVFQLTAHPVDIREAEAVVRTVAAREEDDHWLAELHQRLSEGINAGTYVVLPVISTRSPQESDEDDDEDLVMGGLRTLLRFDERPGDVIWIDDRCMTGFLHRDGCRIADTVEVLAALVSAGGISRVEYFQHLHRLRAANVRFVPPAAEDLSFQLRRARVERGSLVETPELRVFRRYVAATLLDGQTLQRAITPDGTFAERHELSYVAELHHVLGDVLIGLWEDEAMPAAERRARAEWLIRSLFLDLGSAREVVGLHEPHEDDRYLLALSLAGLVVRGLVMEGTFAPEPRPSADEYFEWLVAYVVRPRVEADPLLPAALAHILVQHILQVGETLPPEVRMLRGPALQRLFDRVPTSLQDELAKDAEFMKEVGIVFQRTVEVVGFEFPARAFTRAAARAMNGSSARVALLDGTGSVRLLPSRDPENWREIQLARGRSRWNVVYEGPVADLLRESLEERMKALRALRRYFVGTQAEFEEEAIRVGTLPDPFLRVKAVEAWRAASPAHHYERLTERISDRERIGAEDLRPLDLDAFVRAHGLSVGVETGEALRDGLETATREWIEFEGIRKAILRVCGLPIPLPGAVLKAFVAATPGERRELVRVLLRDTGSPIARIHLLRLMASAPEEFRRLSRWVVRCLLSEGAKVEFRAFAAMLDHADAELMDPAADAWSPALRLAMVWSHAHQLFEAMRQAGVVLKKAPELFGGVLRRELAGLFVRDRDYRADAAHPKRLGRPAFLVTGMAYALQEVPYEPGSIIRPPELMELLAPGEESSRRVDPGVLRDPSLEKDALGSFLAADRGAAIFTLSGDSTADQLGSAGRRRFAEEALDRISEGTGTTEWGRLYDVVEENPLYPEMRGQLERILLEMNFVQMYTSLLEDVRLPLVVGFVQAAHWGSPDLRRHMEDAIAGIAGALPHDGDDAAVEEAALLLMDLTLRMAWGQVEAGATAAEFARIARRLLDQNARLAIHWRIPAERLWTEVPATCARPLAELLVRVRAE